MAKDTRVSDPDRTTLWHFMCAGAGTAADRRNQYRFVAWILAWGISFVGANWVLQNYEGLSGPAAWSLAAVPILFAIASMYAYLHFLRQADEMIRRIQIEGLAIGFGAAVIFMICYPTFERIGAPVLEADTVLVLMMVGWVAGQLIGMWRYR